MNILHFAIRMPMLLLYTTFAYIDPSVMTYTIQAVAGIVIAVGAVVGIIWRNARKKAKQILNIDENANKEVEGDVVEIDPDVKK